MDAQDYCVEGQPHAWDISNTDCDTCGDGNCCLACLDCDATDCYCGDA